MVVLLGPPIKKEKHELQRKGGKQQSHHAGSEIKGLSSVQFRFPIWMAPTQDSSFVVCCSPQLPADPRLFLVKNGTGYLVLICSAASVKP